MRQVVTHISAFVPLTLKAGNTKSTNFFLDSNFIYLSVYIRSLNKKEFETKINIM